YHVAPGQRNEGGQRGALVAAFFLVHLDDDFLAFAQQFLEAGLVRVDPGLEVVAGDFLQRQEAVALAAVFDEGGLERGLEPGDAALVDVGLLLFLRRLLDVDVLRGLAIDDRDPQFFRLRRVDEHSFHCGVPRALVRATTPWAFRLWIPRPRRASWLRRGLRVFQRYDTTAGRGSACSIFPCCGPVSRRGRCPFGTSGEAPRSGGFVQRRRLTRRAMAGLAGEPLTWPPRGRWSRTAAGIEGRGAFGPG